ncbi:MAG TPA: GAF domain-containing protein [Thermodesulfobacteriota bacterium]|nr:GAF domain-containing protein [Thermodesulfobacteriota bacterium]
MSTPARLHGRGSRLRPRRPAAGRQASFFAEVGRLLTSTLEPRAVLNLLVKAAVDLTGASSGSLLLRDAESRLLNIEATRGYPATGRVKLLRLAPGEGITGWVAQHGRSLLVPDVRDDPRYVEVDRAIRSELAVPLRLKGEVLGVINVNSTRVGAFDREDMRLLEALAAQSAAVVQNARLFDAARRRSRALATLFEVGQLVAGSLELDVVLRQVAASTARLLKTYLTSIMLLSPDGQELVLRAVHGGSRDYAERGAIRVDRSFVGRAVRTRRPVMALDVRELKDYASPELARRHGLAALLAVPLVSRGKVLGVINAYKRTRHRWTREEVTLLKSLADLSAVAIENATLFEGMLRLEEELRRMERTSTLQELAIEMAHELRNPLTIIRMLLHSIRADHREDVEVIGAEVARLERLAARFLEQARPKEPVMAPLDLNELLTRLLAFVQPKLAAGKLVVTRELAPALPPVLGDRDQLEQLFLNLVLNAIDALPPGGRLTVATRRAAAGVEAEVADDGPGIPEEVRRRLFEPFNTTKPNGMGLGLAIVRRIAEGHKGTIRVWSEPGRGTSFTLALPAADGRP